MVHWKSAAWVFLALVFGACGPGAATLSYTVSAGNLSVVTGTTGSVSVTANFVSGSGSVPLSLELPAGLSGVTGSFAPASISNTNPGSVLTLNVAQGVAPQTYNLTVRAGSQTAPVALTVVPAFRVEARGGVYNLGSATPGTVLVWKIRRADGTLPTSAIALRFDGPSGWNGGQPITLSYPAAAAGQSSIRSVDFLFRGATPPVAGSYTATATIEGQTYTSTFNLAVVQPLPQPSELIMQSVSTTQVVATWLAAERARSYWAAVSTSSDGVFRATLPDPITTFSANLSASSAFNTTLAHDVRVYAFSADLSGPDPALPTQIDASRQSTDVNFAVGSGTLGGTVSIAPPAAASALDYSGTPLDSFVPGEVIVKFRGISLQRAEPLWAGGVGLQFDRPLGLEGAGLYSTEPDPQSTLRAINELNLRPDVEYAQPNFVYLPTQLTPNDPQYPLQWHYPAINLPQAWSLENGSSNPVTVAVVDTGIFAAHPDFAGKLLPGYDFISSVSSAGDGDGRDPNPEESSPNGCRQPAKVGEV
ncbi:MAG: hypothetical protein SFU83_15940 [Meiothermus sp.]|nr:hypothetical protein [Meiothermus sp.]